MMSLTVKSVPLIALFAAICLINAVAAAPYQELAPKKGYVPVYIRVGNTPLSEIHPKLAEAFHEIPSDSLTLQKASKDEAIQQQETSAIEGPATTTAESKITTESDIASFDVIKNIPNKNEDAEEQK